MLPGEAFLFSEGREALLLGETTIGNPSEDGGVKQDTTALELECYRVV